MFPVYRRTDENNDYLFICLQPLYEKVVAENVPVGTVIVRVTASDDDEPGTPNSAIEYSLDSSIDGTFTIHETLGKGAVVILLLQIPGSMLHEGFLFLSNMLPR